MNPKTIREELDSGGQSSLERCLIGKPDRFIRCGRALKRIHHDDPRYKDAPFEETITTLKESVLKVSV